MKNLLSTLTSALLLTPCLASAGEWYVEGSYGKGAEMSDDSGYSASAFVAGYARDRLSFQLGYEHGEAKLLGQPAGTFDSATASVGYSLPVSHDFSFNIDLGIWYPVTTKLFKPIEEEIAYTYLVNKHSAGGTKPIPLDPVDSGDYIGCATLEWYGHSDPNCYDSAYEIDPSPYVSIGAEYVMSPHLSVGVSYRYLRPYRFVAIGKDSAYFKDPEATASGNGYWEERANVNYDSVFLTFRYTF